MSNKAIDHVTVDINYDRPYYEFPDLSSEKGNPYVYWKEAQSVVQRHGYKKEAEQIGSVFMKIPYSEQFDYLVRFLDISPKEEQYKEDEDYIYLKVSKNKINNSNIKQPMLFNIKNIETIKDLYEEGEDFSIKNCYGRNIFHYINDPYILTYLLEKNREDNFIDLFELDHFNSTVLQTHDNITTFNILLTEMYNLNPELTKVYFSGTNVFNNNASGVYLSTLDNLFAIKGLKNIDTLHWKEFANSLKIIKLVNPEMQENIISQIPNLPIFQDKNNSNTTIQNMLYLLLENNLEEKKQTSKKIKI